MQMLNVSNRGFLNHLALPPFNVKLSLINAAGFYGVLRTSKWGSYGAKALETFPDFCFWVVLIKLSKYININKKCFHVLINWRMYYEYTGTTKQVLTFVKTVITSTIL